MDKPREFVIHSLGDIGKGTDRLECTGPWYPEDSPIIVIEKSAYDRAKEISRNLEHSVARLKKQNEILREALEHCRDFDTSAKFGYEYGQKVRGHIPKPGTRFKTPKEMAQQALSDCESVE